MSNLRNFWRSRFTGASCGGPERRYSHKKAAYRLGWLLFGGVGRGRGCSRNPVKIIGFHAFPQAIGVPVARRLSKIKRLLAPLSRGQACRAPGNDKRYVAVSLRAIRRIAGQSQALRQDFFNSPPSFTASTTNFAMRPEQGGQPASAFAQRWFLSAVFFHRP